jgi:HPt (histidine-containing phosphotransfer) domain-containing protein
MPSPSGFADGLAQDLGDRDFRHLLHLLREDLTGLLRAMDSAVAANDTEGFRRVAHGLVGAATTVGAAELEHSGRVAMAATTLRADDARDIRRHANDVLAEIARVLGANPPPGPP